MNICEPAENAVPEPTRVTGLIQTSHEVAREDVFEIVENPPSRVARVGPTTNVLESWRDVAMIDAEFKATRIAWPLSARLFPGAVLHPGIGLAPWRAEQAVNGLIDGEPYFVEAVTGLLAQVKGVVLVLPGDLRALIVREAYFDSGAIEIGERLYFSELPEAEDLETPELQGEDSEADGLTTHEEGSEETGEEEGPA